MSLSADDVKEILNALESSSFDEMILETNDLKFVVRRKGAGTPSIQQERPGREPESVAGQERTSSPALVTDATGGSPPKTQIAGDLVDIKASMLGTFYAAAKPGAAPFVAVGSLIGEGATIGIIEVMKLMNSVCSEVSGEVVEICAKDGELVEYGQILFRVRQVSQ